MKENEIGMLILAAAIEVHRELGPGLLESVYEVVLAVELSTRGLTVARQIPVPIVYKGIRFDEGFRADLIVNGKVLVELKYVPQFARAFAVLKPIRQGSQDQRFHSRNGFVAGGAIRHGTR